METVRRGPGALAFVPGRTDFPSERPGVAGPTLSPDLSMSDDLPDLSEFDKYLDDEELEKPRGSGGLSSGSKAGAAKGAGSRTRKGGGSSKGRPRRWLWLLVGLLVGAAGTAFLPELVRPHLPLGLRLGETEVPGLVLEERREADRLLLTVDTERGATLATFTHRVSEIDLLVSAGDSVTLGLGTYAPLVEDPTLAGVRKGREGAGGGVSEPEVTAPPSGASQGARAPDTSGRAPEEASPDTAGG